MDKEASLMEIGGRKVHILETHKTNPDYSTDKQQVFIIGSKGIPANYGGFETFVEKLTEYQVSDKIRYHVARIGKKDFRFHYNGAKCFNLSVPDIGPAKAVYYDCKALQWSIDYCLARPAIRRPAFYVLACRIGPFIKYFKKQIRKLGGVLYVNPDGHEWKRKKWSLLVRKYWKLSEMLMVRQADLMICDSRHIEKYIREEYKRYSPKTTYIAYGSDIKPSVLGDNDKKFLEWCRDNGLKAKNYYLVVARFVPENNFEKIISEFMKTSSLRDLIIITTQNPRYLERLEKKLHFKGDSRIKFIGTVYDQELLKKIREKAYGYLHGHEVGGTNPTLLESLESTDLNLLLNVRFNREVAGEAAFYWGKEEGVLAGLIDRADRMEAREIEELGLKAKERIAEQYSWNHVIDLYEKVFTQPVFTLDNAMEDEIFI